VLLQRRAAGKYHSGGLWANTCCGHPRLGERSPHAARRRLGEELGDGLARSSPLQFGFHARYRTLLDRGLCENELVYVYGGRMGDGLMPEPSEVSETRLMPLEALMRDASDNPAAYVYWLRHYLAQHTDALTALRDTVLEAPRALT
jgi:isopentenyl-diphosphate delta-isomerase